MNISTSSTGTSTTSLTQELANLQKEFDAEAQSKDSAKVKEQAEASLEIQITMVTAQIAEAKQNAANSDSTAPAASTANVSTYA